MVKDMCLISQMHRAIEMPQHIPQRSPASTALFSAHTRAASLSAQLSHTTDTVANAVNKDCRDL